MLHFGKTPQGELEINATGEDVGILYRAVCAAHLTERGTLHALKTYVEENFTAELKGGSHV